MSVIRPPIAHVADTGTARGRGVFADRAFCSGDLVEVSPVVVLEFDYDRLPIVLQRMVFSWPGTSGAVHALALGYGSLYNAANPSNLRFERDVVQGVVRFHAARDIAAGEELTINYSAADGGASTHTDEWFVEHGIVRDSEAVR